MTDNATSEVCEHLHLQLIRRAILWAGIVERCRRTGWRWSVIYRRGRGWGSKAFANSLWSILPFESMFGEFQIFIDLLLREGITEDDEDVHELLRVDFFQPLQVCCNATRNCWSALRLVMMLRRRISSRGACRIIVGGFISSNNVKKPSERTPTGRSDAATHTVTTCHLIGRLGRSFSEGTTATGRGGPEVRELAGRELLGRKKHGRVVGCNSLDVK